MNGAKTHLDQSGIGWRVLLKRVNFKVGGDKFVLHRQFELSIEVSILPVLKEDNEISETLKTHTNWRCCETSLNKTCLIRSDINFIL